MSSMRNFFFTTRANRNNCTVMQKRTGGYNLRRSGRCEPHLHQCVQYATRSPNRQSSVTGITHTNRDKRAEKERDGEKNVRTIGPYMYGLVEQEQNTKQSAMPPILQCMQKKCSKRKCNHTRKSEGRPIKFLVITFLCPPALGSSLRSNMNFDDFCCFFFADARLLVLWLLLLLLLSSVLSVWDRGCADCCWYPYAPPLLPLGWL